MTMSVSVPLCLSEFVCVDVFACVFVCLCRAVVSFAGLRVLCQCFLVVLCRAAVHKLLSFVLSSILHGIRMLGVDPRGSDLSVISD